MIKQSTYQMPTFWLSLLTVALLVACGGDDGSEMMPEIDAMVEADGSVSTDQNVVDAATPCDCEAVTSCTDEGECVVCSADTECSDARICVSGACGNGCADDAACDDDPAGAVCTAGRCVQCAVDDDCFGGATCGADLTCSEPDMCLDTRECSDPRVCLSGVCADRPDCNVNFECPVGQECQADGSCVVGSGEGCLSDDECPRVGDVCLVEGRESICGRCRTDEDCGSEFRCAESGDTTICVERSGCTVDSQCLNGRICNPDGNCSAPPCADDDREENDVSADAVAISSSIYTGLVSCAEDPDWYRFTLTSDYYASIQIRQDGLDADLTLTAYNADNQILAEAATAEPNETIIVGPFPTQLEIFIAVTQAGTSGSTESYTLELSIEDAGLDCVEDAIDNTTGDDSIDRARSVRQVGQIGFDREKLTGTICPLNQDVFCFQMNSQEQLFVGVKVVSGDAVIEGEVVRPDGDSVATGQWQRMGEQTNISTRTGTGEYCLQLNAIEGFGNYEVRLQAFDSRLEDVCAESQAVSWQGDSMTLQGMLSDDDTMTPQCATQADGGEYRYRVTFDASDNLPLLVNARAAGVPGGTLGDPVVSVRRACASAASEIACTAQSFDANDPTTPRVNPAQLKFLVEEPGTYYVIVDGRDVGDLPTFRLDMSATPAGAALGETDLCGDDTPPLPLNPDGVTSFAVNLDRATNAVSNCSGLRGPDAVYKVNFNETSDVRLQALAVDQGFAVGASLVRACDDANPVACGFGFESRVEPGEYFLVIEGADSYSRGRVTVQMVVEPLGAVATNDTCEDAEAIGGSGTLVGTTATAADDYVLTQANTCTGYNTQAPDVVYRLSPPAGGPTFVTARPIGGWDLSLYVYSDCSNLISPMSRVACSPDGALTERLVFDPATTPGPYYVIVDGTNGESGEFELSWGAVECTVTDDCQAGRVCDPLTYQCQ